MAIASEREIQELAEKIGADDGQDLDKVDSLLGRYPEDARLHFMRGSILAGLSKAILAHEAMTRALQLEPGFELARYQLGFFELTSGEADRALATWGPLLRLGQDRYLRRFVDGMTYMIRDEFESAIAEFEAGIALNAENEPMNADIRLLIGKCRELAAGTPRKNEDQLGRDEVSATALLLSQFGPRTLQ